MKTRVISSIVGLVLLAGVLFFGKYALGIAVLALSIIGLNEYYNAVVSAAYKPIKIIGFAACFPIILISLFKDFIFHNGDLNGFSVLNYLCFALFIIIMILFTFTIFKNEKYNLNDISLTIFGILYVPFLFSFIILTRNFDNGFALIWFIFIGAWVTDTAAYFSGVLMGNRKLLPAISPKKTLEGSIGGVVGCILGTAVYGYFMVEYGLLDTNAALYHFAILGLLNGIISQIGDWAASSIKRYVKIKDYGNIMPGHGGVLDRFDSIIFVAPVVYFYLSFFVL